MATNNIKPFATSSSANVLNDTELASRSELQTGFPFKSKADSKLVGKLMQNATAGAYAVGEFSAKYGTTDITGSDATGFATAFESALQAYVNEKAPSPDLSSYAKKEELPVVIDLSSWAQDIGLDLLNAYSGKVINITSEQLTSFYNFFGVSSPGELDDLVESWSSTDKKIFICKINKNGVYYSTKIASANLSGNTLDFSFWKTSGAHPYYTRASVYVCKGDTQVSHNPYVKVTVSPCVDDPIYLDPADFNNLHSFSRTKTQEEILDIFKCDDKYIFDELVYSGKANWVIAKSFQQFPRDYSYQLLVTTVDSTHSDSSLLDNKKGCCLYFIGSEDFTRPTLFVVEITLNDTTANSDVTFSGKHLGTLTVGSDLLTYAPLASPALTGTATLNGQNIATVNQIPDTSHFVTDTTLASYPTSETVEAEFSSYDKNIKAHIESELTGYASLTGAAFSGVVTVQEPTAASNPATKQYVDSAVASVYKYKGSVANQSALPSSNQVVGDVYNVEDTGDNFAWDGSKWDKLAGTVDLSSYLTIANASSTYQPKGDYATNTALAAKADASALANYAPLANPAFTGTATLGGQAIATVNQIPDISTKINISGSRGTLAGYEITSVGAAALTVNQDSPDSQQLTAAVAITVSDGTANQSWVKKVSIKDAGTTISLGSAWKWVGGSQPTVTAPSLLVLSWDNDCGIAILQTTA